MVTFHIILRYDAVVFDSGLAEKIGGVGFLKQGITDVFLVTEDFVDGRGVPSGFARSGQNAVTLKSGLDFVHAVAFQIFPVDALYGFSLNRIYDQIAVSILGVAEKVIMVHLHLALLVTVLKSQLDILA